MKDGKYFSNHFGCTTWIRTVKMDTKYPYCECECCGKPLFNYVSVVPEIDITGYGDHPEYMYGTECVKKLGLKKIKE